MTGKKIVWQVCVLASGVGSMLLGTATTHAALTPARPGYAIKHQINGAGVGPIDLVSDSELIAGSFTYDTSFNSMLAVKPVALNSGPVGSTIYTQSLLDPPATSTHAGGVVSTDGTYALSGQTGTPADGNGLFPGRICLTTLTGGATSTLDVPGNWDATSANGSFYITAAAGTTSGLGDNGYSGVYQAQQTTGTLTEINLVLDTGAPSGTVVGDSAGNLAFSLGGVSALLGGGLNDLYRLTSTQVANGVAAGTTTGLAGSAADRLITGSALASAADPFFSSQIPAGGSIFTGISDIVFAGNGDLIVGMSGYIYDDGWQWVGTAGLAMLIDVTNNAGDYSANVSNILYTNTTDGGGSLAYRSSDTTLWVSTDNNLYGVNVPEPGTLALLGLGMIGLVRSSRRGTN